MTWRDVCTAALQELGVYQPSETPAPEDLAYALAKSNRLLDNWNAERAAVYNVGFTTYTLTPMLSPHTIGPSGTLTVPQRPVTVDAANLILNNVTPNVRMPLDLVNDQQWNAISVPTLETTIPTALYYSPDWPNGALYLWPIPTIAYGLEIETRTVLSQVTLATAISLPPGYLDAITLSLAESLIGQYPRAGVAETLIPQAAKARARIFANNDVAPLIRTQDAGMPSSSARTETFNYLTRQWS